MSKEDAKATVISMIRPEIDNSTNRRSFERMLTKQGKSVDEVRDAMESLHHRVEQARAPSLHDQLKAEIIDASTKGKETVAEGMILRGKVITGSRKKLIKAVSKAYGQGGIGGRGAIFARGIGGRGADEVVDARPAGGVLPAFVIPLITAAAPIVIQGVKKLIKKIGERRAARGSGILPLKVPIKYQVPPKSGEEFWRRVYKVAAHNIPRHFTDKAKAAGLCGGFIRKHRMALVGKLARSVASSEPMIKLSHILSPIISHITGKGMSDEYLSHSMFDVPVGGSVGEMIMKVLQNPEVQKFGMKVFGAVAPKVVRRIKGWLRGKLDKMKNKTAANVLKSGLDVVSSTVEKGLNPAGADGDDMLSGAVRKGMDKLTDISPTLNQAARVIGEEAVKRDAIEPPEKVAEVKATEASGVKRRPAVRRAYGLGISSADQYTRRGVRALAVINMAKKM